MKSSNREYEKTNTIQLFIIYYCSVGNWRKILPIVIILMSILYV